MDRSPLWSGEIDIVRAIFGHAAHIDPDRLHRITPRPIAGRVVEVTLEERIGRRRLDVLATFHDDNRGLEERLVIEAKVGAVVNVETLNEYMTSARTAFGPATGLVVSAYEPVGERPTDWGFCDLENVAKLLSCEADCSVCKEIHYAVTVATKSDSVREWRALAEATRSAAIPEGWVKRGGGSSVGRPLVWFESPWLDDAEDSYVSVEVGNNYGLPTASVMVVALGMSRQNRIAFPDSLWRAISASSRTAPPLPDGIFDASVKARGAKGPAGIDASRNCVPATWSRGFSQPGWHGRGRTLRQSDGDYSALLPAAVEQGEALFEAARTFLRHGEA